MSVPRYFVELNEKGVVIRGVVALSEDWCTEHLGGVWKETFMNRPDKRYAGPGYEYVAEYDNFREAQPYPSWSFDVDNWAWLPPIPMPVNNNGLPQHLNEDAQVWVEN